MTPKGLLDFFESYYVNKYTATVKDVMLNYLKDCKKEFLEAAADVIILRYSGCYGKVPDIAIIENNLEEIYKVMTDMQIKNALPEPLPERDYEAHEECMRELERLERKYGNESPMSNSLNKLLVKDIEKRQIGVKQ